MKGELSTVNSMNRHLLFCTGTSPLIGLFCQLVKRSLPVVCLFGWTFQAVAIPLDTVPYALLSDTFAGGVPNVIMDKNNSLLPFFEELSQLRSFYQMLGDTQATVSVVHIGDSHIQADMMTGVTRKLMQQNFGAAGRGLIAPLRLTNTNESRNYRITSEKQWSYNRLVKPGAIPIGIAGLGLQVQDTLVRLSVKTIDETFPGEWAFNKITAYYDTRKSTFNLLDSTQMIRRKKIGSYAEQIVMDHLVTELDLDFSSPVNNQVSFFGFNLANGMSGVFYHAIGINGACFSNYATELLLCEQVSYLKPNLIVISLGTNEAYAKTVNEDKLYAAIADAVFHLRKFSPNAIILLTTPPEHLKRYARAKRGPNPLVEDVRNVIVRYAETNGYAYWDMYKITGGKNSAWQWNKKGLLQKDGIHFTRRGYEFQGELFFEALSKAYNEYLKKHSNAAL